MGKQRKKPQRKPGDPYRLALRMPADLGLVEHLSSEAAGLGLTTMQRRRIGIAARLAWMQPLMHAAMIYQTGHAWSDWRQTGRRDDDLVARAIAIAVTIRAALAACGPSPTPAAPFRIDIDHAASESLVHHLSAEAVRLALSERQRELLNDAVRIYEAAPRGITGAGMRGAALAVATDIQDQLGAAIGETVALDGGKVTRGNGTVRFHDRDGLAALYDAGALNGVRADGRPMADDDAEAVAGARLSGALVYRTMYEVTGSDLRSQLGAEASGGGDGDAFRFYRALDGAQRKDVEALVGVRVGTRGLLALRLVAGEGRLISSIGSGGKCLKLNTAALIAALDVVARHLRVPGCALLTTVPE